jgi:hypothetical protein
MVVLIMYGNSGRGSLNIALAIGDHFKDVKICNPVEKEYGVKMSKIQKILFIGSFGAVFFHECVAAGVIPVISHRNGVLIHEKPEIYLREFSTKKQEV